MFASRWGKPLAVTFCGDCCHLVDSVLVIDPTDGLKSFVQQPAVNLSIRTGFYPVFVCRQTLHYGFVIPISGLERGQTKIGSLAGIVDAFDVLARRVIGYFVAKMVAEITRRDECLRVGRQTLLRGGCAC